MLPEKRAGKVFLVCRKCGMKKGYGKQSFKIAGKATVENHPVLVMDKEITALPKTKIICPKCGNGEAYWWLQQTRSADEAPTLFFRCTKCEHAWRKYS